MGCSGGKSLTAFLFPGQGAQKVGMAEGLPGELLQEADKIFKEEVGESLLDVIENGPQDKLNRTLFTQPAVFAVSFAAFKLLNYRPDFAAGHSLGEYTAFAAAGVASFDDMFRLVIKRARAMDKACETNPGAMSAVIGLDSKVIEDVVSELSKKGVIVVANYNSLSQVVISGEVNLVEEAEVILKEKGAKRVVRLPVSGAFHSPLMKEASAELFEAIDSVSWRDPEFPVVANATASPIEKASQIPEVLKKQLTSSVLWVQTLQFMKNSGVTRYVEVGPGNILQGLVKKTLSDVEVLSYKDFGR